MDLTPFRSDSKKFAQITGKPMVLDEFMTKIFLRPIIDIVKTNEPFSKFQNDHNISMVQHMDSFAKEANEILSQYLL